MIVDGDFVLPQRWSWTFHQLASRCHWWLLTAPSVSLQQLAPLCSLAAGSVWSAVWRHRVAIAVRLQTTAEDITLQMLVRCLSLHDTVDLCC